MIMILQVLSNAWNLLRKQYLFQGIGLLCCMGMFRTTVQFHLNYMAWEGNIPWHASCLSKGVSNVN